MRARLIAILFCLALTMMPEGGFTICGISSNGRIANGVAWFAGGLSSGIH